MILAGLSVHLSMSGNFLSCSKGVKDPFEIQEGRCDLPPDASVESDLISPEGRTSWIFSSCIRFLLNYDRDLRDPNVWPQERPVSMRVVRVHSGFLSNRFWVLRSRLEMRPDSEVSSPVLTCIWGFLWSLHRGVKPRLEWRHARPLSFYAVTAVTGFPSCLHRDLWLSHVAFPQGCHTGHRGVSRYSA